jgi:DNA invertase Pin-like site-specific DNA recombinase
MSFETPQDQQQVMTMSTIGYARVSTEQQSLLLQKDALEKVCDQIFEEKESGAHRDRPQLKVALDCLKSGDTLVIYKLDRLGRSVRDLMDIVNELKDKGVIFRSLNESIDTSSPAGKCFFHVIAAICEMERDLIRERTKAGLESARRQGRTGGRPDKFNASQIQLAKDLDQQGKPRTEIAKSLGMSRATLYRLLDAG